MDRARDSRTRTRSALNARLRRWLRPPRTLRPTRAGWTFFALTFGVGFAALNTGNNLLYLVLSLMLAFLVLSGVLSESALRGIGLRRRIPRELHDGGVHLVALEISNAQRRVPAFALVVEDHVRERGGAERPAGPRLRAAHRPGRDRAPQLPLSADAARALRVHELSRLDPLSLRPVREGDGDRGARARARLSRDRTRHGAERASAARGRTASRSRGPRGTGTDVGGLRGFASGDPVRRIHWRATLRQRELLVRDVESEHAAEVELRLRTHGVDPGEEFERRVRWVASEAVALLEAGLSVALRTDHAHVRAAPRRAPARACCWPSWPGSSPAAVAPAEAA